MYLFSQLFQIQTHEAKLLIYVHAYQSHRLDLLVHQRLELMFHVDLVGHCIVVLNDGKYSKAILKMKDKLTNKDSSSYSRFKDIYYA